ncbi:MAG: GNAT family N-acetyltransferase [Halobacteriota archaeon]|uniref:GNAT family N-acetyltransferase n=1 Tax=Natronomonas sp. TaxID=2184060 RepID=UPI00397666FB
MEIRWAEDDETLDDALSVRRDVFIREQGVPEHRELDGEDANATHFVAYDDGEPIGTARLRRHGGTDRGDTGKIERVAVVEERRGEGLGREIMDAVERAARETGYGSVVLHAQVPVVPFYADLGYEPIGEEFEDAGISHRKMRKSLR